MSKDIRDWFDKHVVVMGFDNDKKKQKAFKSDLKKATTNKFQKRRKTK
tara:strand:+ start:156 stop:299 length:144 start_codon:yes stop_codon:yes gene_type:complete